MTEVASATALPRRFAIMVAVLYGLSCHVAFVAGVGAMMIVLFSGMTLGLGRLPTPWSWCADALLLLQFPLLHTALLSRPGGAALRRLAPPGLGTPLMTTTYALIASLQTGLLFLGWTPIGRVLWQAHGATLAIFAIGYTGAWLLLLRAIIDAGFALQTGLLGWRAVVRGQAPVYPPLPTRGLFRLIRQPIYVAFALTLWTVPTITPDGLVVALVLTAYCLIGSMVKEARFARRFGAAFSVYRARTPFWFPLLSRRNGQ
jgi:protein-S-isoprenylcysteine O-methyltransferase Ste14